MIQPGDYVYFKPRKYPTRLFGELDVSGGIVTRILFASTKATSPIVEIAIDHEGHRAVILSLELSECWKLEQDVL